MTIIEKAAYLKGLVEGLGVEPESRDGKLWGALNDLLGDMAHEIEDLQSGSLDFADALDEIGDELSYLEDLTCDLDTPEDFEECDGDCASCQFECPGSDDEEDDEDDEGEDEDDEGEDEDEDDDFSDAEGEEEEEDEELQYDGVMYDVKCPVCGEEITFDEETLDEGSIVCPKCGETLEFDLDGDEE